MLRGRFGDTTGRPYIEGRLLLPRFRIRSDISFLVDTGADVSLLNPADGTRMGLDYARLTGNVESLGTSGVSYNYVEPAFIVFSERGRFLHVYRINLEIAPYDRKLMELPSLLGRDILDQWKMTYNPSKKRLVFEVLSSDETIPI